MKTKKKKVVLIQGCFDMFHWMHLESLRLAKAQGDFLIVLVNTDKLVKRYKGKGTVFSEKYRLDMINSIRFVDQAIFTTTFSPLWALKKYQVDVYCLCDEWVNTKKKEIEWMKQSGGGVKILPYVDARFTPAQKRIFKVRQFNNLKDKHLRLCQKCHQKI